MVLKDLFIKSDQVEIKGAPYYAAFASRAMALNWAVFARFYNNHATCIEAVFAIRIFKAFFSSV